MRAFPCVALAIGLALAAVAAHAGDPAPVTFKWRLAPGDKFDVTYVCDESEGTDEPTLIDKRTAQMTWTALPDADKEPRLSIELKTVVWTYAMPGEMMTVTRKVDGKVDAKWRPWGHLAHFDDPRLNFNPADVAKGKLEWMQKDLAAPHFVDVRDGHASFDPSPTEGLLRGDLDPPLPATGVVAGQSFAGDRWPFSFTLGLRDLRPLVSNDKDRAPPTLTVAKVTDATIMVTSKYAGGIKGNVPGTAVTRSGQESAELVYELAREGWLAHMKRTYSGTGSIGGIPQQATHREELVVKKSGDAAKKAR